MPFREITCPHCFRTVYVRDDSKCPACCRDTSQAPPESAGLTPVEFVDGEQLPPVCLVCGHDCESYVVVGEKNEQATRDRTTIFSRILGLVGGVIAIPINPSPLKPEYKISIRIPVCERHKNSSVLSPIFVDYKRFRITLPAHLDFQEKWKQRLTKR
jgi:hypothetical protein